MNKKKIMIFAVAGLAICGISFFGIRSMSNIFTEQKEDLSLEEKREQELLENNYQRYNLEEENKTVREDNLKNATKDDPDIDSNLKSFDNSTAGYVVIPEREDIREFKEKTYEESLEEIKTELLVRLDSKDIINLTVSNIKSLGRYPTVREIMYAYEVNIDNKDGKLIYKFNLEGEPYSVEINSLDTVMDLLSLVE